MKGKSFAILAALLLLLSLVPIGIASAAQGTVELKATDGATDKTRYSAESTGANNIALIKVGDTDLDVAKSIPSTAYLDSATNKRYEIVGTTNGQTTLTVANSPIADNNGDGEVTPVDVTVRGFQAGSSYFGITGMTESSILLSGGAIPATQATTRLDPVGVTVQTGFPLGSDNTTNTVQVGAPTQLRFSVDQTSVSGTVTVNFNVTKINPTTGATTDVTVAYTVASDVTNVYLKADGTTSSEAVAVTDAQVLFISAFRNAAVDGTTGAVVIDYGTSATGTVDVKVEETYTVGVFYKYADYNNTDSVSGTTTTKTLKITSGANPTGLTLTGTETTKISKVFNERVAFIAAADLNTINACMQAETLTTSSLISSLVTGLTKTNVSACNSAAVADWVTATTPNLVRPGSSGALQAVATSDTIAELLNRTIAVNHGDTVTVTYDDKTSGSAVTDTATIDLVKPTLASVSPKDGDATNDATPLLTGVVTDTDAGILAADVKVYVDGSEVPNNTHTGTLEKDTATGGFTVRFTTATLSEGDHYWELKVTDKVGNASTTGASSDAAKRIDFKVDLTKPVLNNAVTGTGIKLDAADADNDTKTDDYIEFASSEWIKVSFTEASGALDAASVAAADFSISTGGASDVLVKKGVFSKVDSSVTQITNPETYAYLKVSALAADAKPKIKLVEAVADKAGNAALFDTASTTTTEKTSVDGIAPTLTVVPSPTLGKKEDKVTITATSTEALVSDLPPTVSINTSPATTVAMTAGTTANTWTGTYTVKSGDKAEFTVTATGTDKSTLANSHTKTAKFQADDGKPAIAFQNPSSTDQQLQAEDVIFLNVKADDGSPTVEYTGDTNTKTTITSAVLEKLSAKAGTVTTTTTLAVADFKTSDNITYIYGWPSPAVGFYKLTVAAKDVAGNELTGSNIAFEVIERQPISVALSPGWNLVSLPQPPVDPNIEAVLADPKTGTKMTTITTVYSLQGGVWKTTTWNATTSKWEGTLTQITDGYAYWVRSTSFDAIKFLSKAFSPVATQPAYALKTGWNSIGVTTTADALTVEGYLASIKGKWTTVRSYTPLAGFQTAFATGDFTAGFTKEATDLNGDTDTKDATVVKGQGYFVYVSGDTTLAP